MLFDLFTSYILNSFNYSISSEGALAKVYGKRLEKIPLRPERTTNRIITGNPFEIQASKISGATVTITPPIVDTRPVPRTLTCVGYSSL
jgi:hypothetical protein